MHRDVGRGSAFALALVLLAGAGAGARGDADYEESATLGASELLPPELLRGPHHVVEEEVRTDGFVRVYTLSSDFGRYEARGQEALRARVREIEALAALQESSRSETFARAAERAGRQPTAGADAIAVPGLPVGAVPSRPEPTGEEGAGRRTLDAEAMKRRIAAELGIDPYTANEALQAELQRHAWVAAVGGLSSMRVSEAAAPERADAGAPAATARVDTLLRDWSADDLEALNRIELAAMGVGKPLREEFLSNPSYSPRTGTVLVEALSALEGTDDREAFIEAAVEAESADEALAFQRMAELIRGYGEESGGVQKITTVDGRIAAFAADGTLVVPVLADHALWTERVAGFAESMARAAGRDPEVARTRFLVSGSVSSRARSEIKELGIEVTEGAGAAPGE